MRASYNVKYETYYGSFLQDGYDVDKRFFKVRYLIFNPNISRSDTFVSNWGVLIMFFILWFLITSIVFIRKDIISDRAVFLFQTHKPFFSVTDNDIEDYDQHDIDHQNLDAAQLDLKLKFQAEKKLSPSEEIKADIYKYNPNAVFIFVIYVFYFFWFFVEILRSSFSYPEIFAYGAILIFVPLYVQNTRNPVFKMKIPNEGCLSFSSKGIQYKDDLFALEEIESVVVYLESFRGFEYRDRVSTGNINTTSDGDNNKISFRYKGVVSDLTFILNSSHDYWAFKNLMSSWATKGINIILQKVFEDDFVIQEMVHFHT